MSVDVAQATEIAAIVAACASVGGVLAQYTLARRHELTKWQREHLLPTLFQMLTQSKRDRELLVDNQPLTGQPIWDKKTVGDELEEMRGISEQITLLSPGLAEQVAHLFDLNSGAFRAALIGRPPRVIDGWAQRISAVEDSVTKAAHIELGLRPTLRRRIRLRVSSKSIEWRMKRRTNKAVARMLRSKTSEAKAKPDPGTEDE